MERFYWKPKARGNVLTRGTSKRAKGQRGSASRRRWLRCWLAEEVSCGTTEALEGSEGSRGGVASEMAADVEVGREAHSGLTP